MKKRRARAKIGGWLYEKEYGVGQLKGEQSTIESSKGAPKRRQKPVCEIFIPSLKRCHEGEEKKK